jgi:endonuclease/exonuclease/phosphatase family metal-dependent hydrolase
MLAMAVIVFGAIFLAGIVQRWLGARAWLIVGGGVAAVRLIEQLNPAPALDLILAALGVILFFWFVAITCDALRATHLDRHFPTAMLLGISIDTTMKGAFGTIDLSWVPGVLPVIIVGILAAAALWLLRGLPRPDRVEDASTSWLLIALGAFLFLEAQVFQNIGFNAVATGWPLPLSFELIILANAFGLIVASLIYDRMPRRAWTWTFIIGLILIIVSLPLEGDPLAGLELFAGQIVAAIGLTVIAQARGRWHSSFVMGLAVILGLLLTAGYYLTHIGLPVPYWLFVALAGLILAGAMILTVLRFGEPQPTDRVDWTPGVIGLGLMLVPLIALLAWRDPVAVPGKFPVRVMSYNLHSGFDVTGRMDLEALAQTIEREQADVIALQEVSRGWIINTSADMLTWLSQRLNLPYVWGSTADALWGNAILSRYPIGEVQLHAMPNNDEVHPARGFLVAVLDVGGAPLRVMATHFHHADPDGTKRLPQSQAMLDAWAQQPGTVLLGDLNAPPEAPEMQMLRTAGLIDAFDEAGQGAGLTFRSNDLYKRIDYIYHSPDLIARDFNVNPSTMSDHLGVAVTLDLK